MMAKRDADLTSPDKTAEVIPSRTFKIHPGGGGGGGAPLLDF